MRAFRLLPLLAVLLAACSDERASFMANDQQSLTAIVRQEWFWSAPELFVVVRGEPNCQKEYFVQQLSEQKPPLEVYAYEGSSHALLAAGQKYVFDLSNCEMTRYRDIPDLRRQDLLGTFAWQDGAFDFRKQR